MFRQTEVSHAELIARIEAGEVAFAGHARLRIYGRLDCRAGRRYMAPANRVFFASEAEAIEADFRPCSACMKAAYRAWKEARLAERRAAAPAWAAPVPGLWPGLPSVAPLAPPAPGAPAAAGVPAAPAAGAPAGPALAPLVPLAPRAA